MIRLIVFILGFLILKLFSAKGNIYEIEFLKHLAKTTFFQTMVLISFNRNATQYNARFDLFGRGNDGMK